MLRIVDEIKDILDKYDDEKGVWRAFKDHPDIKKLRHFYKEIKHENYLSTEHWDALLQMFRERKQRKEHLSFALFDDLSDAIFGTEKNIAKRLQTLNPAERILLAQSFAYLGKNGTLTTTNCHRVLMTNPIDGEMKDNNKAVTQKEKMMRISESAYSREQAPTSSAKVLHVTPPPPKTSFQQSTKSSLIPPSSSSKKPPSSSTAGSSLVSQTKPKTPQQKQPSNSTSSSTSEKSRLKKIMEEIYADDAGSKSASKLSSADATTYEKKSSQKSMIENSSSSVLFKSSSRTDNNANQDDDAKPHKDWIPGESFSGEGAESEEEQDNKAYVKACLGTLLAVDIITPALYKKALSYANPDEFARKIKILSAAKDLNASSIEEFLAQNSKSLKKS